MHNQFVRTGAWDPEPALSSILGSVVQLGDGRQMMKTRLARGVSGAVWRDGSGADEERVVVGGSVQNGVSCGGHDCWTHI